MSGGGVRAVAGELYRLPSYADPTQRPVFVEQCARILAVVVPYAEQTTPGRAARKARMLVTALDQRGHADRRQQAAEREHGVWVTPTGGGACEIRAAMPLPHGLAVMDAVNTLVHDDRFQTSDGCITIGQRRVAALVALMLGDPGSVGRIDGPVTEAKLNARISVVVPIDTIAGTGEQGGVIGSEPVTADVLRDLITDAHPRSTFQRLVTDATGCIIDAGRTRYAVSPAQRRLLALRDGTCRFPGCQQKAIRCEIDHATPYDTGGHTSCRNLGPLCKHHHQLKTHGGWRITESHRSGRCTWRSPLGRIYEHQPPDLLPPPPPLRERERDRELVDAEPPPF